MIGFAALFLALVFAVIAAFTAGCAVYCGPCDPRSVWQDKTSGLFYRLSAASVGVAVLHLWFLILTDQFKYYYVYAYSERNLALFYKIAAFWAGQEGSLLFWVLLHAVLGLALLRPKVRQPAVTACYALLQAGLLIILLIKSPFMIITPVPGDGSGLNPLLQNPWMISHPPVLFFGYACLAVPLALAVGSLFGNDRQSWLRPALFWSLLAWVALGLGIFMGGYWAYEVLGWGGYWAWDPVENSSLIPWLINGILVHLLLVGLRRPQAVKPAYLAALFAYAAALYGTFLTRSGVLSDFSTHSFTNQGVGVALAALVMTVLAASLVLFIVKWPTLPGGSGERAETEVQSREFMTLAGTMALAALAAVVLFGTSAPLFTTLLGNPQGVNTSYYNTTSLPLACCMLLAMILASVFPWGKAEISLSPRVFFIVIPGFLTLAVGLLYNIRMVMFLLLLGLAGLAFGAAACAVKKGLSNPAVVTHMGVSVLLIGVIFSSAASRTEIIAVLPGEQRLVFGREVIYAGEETIDSGQGYRQKFVLDGKKLSALTRYDKTGRFSVHEPAISRSLRSDFYLAPSIDHSDGGDNHELILGQPFMLAQESLLITLLDYGMSNEDPVNTAVYALLEVDRFGEIQQVKLELVKNGGVFSPVPVGAFDQYTLYLLAVSISDNKILLSVDNMTGSSEQITVEISEKPLINLVWLGTVIISLGTAWAAYKRRGPRPFRGLL